MKYKSFRIQNFKGIKDTTVDFRSAGGVSIFAFVGLNESGKTTVLEAIHSFSPDESIGELMGGNKEIGVPFRRRVPRHLISGFTGNISITATLSVADSDKNMINEYLSKYGLCSEKSNFPDEVVFERRQHFENGDFKADHFDLLTNIKVRGLKQRKYRAASLEELPNIHRCVYSCAPDIAYFPTFVFEFPSKIYLTERGGVVDKFYRGVFQDILDYDKRGQTIEKDIIKRIRGRAMIVPWASFFDTWRKNDDKEKLDHVMDRAGAAVTKLIFGRWNKVFGEDTKDKEVIISYDVVEGEVYDRQGNTVKTNSHDITVKFKIKDGTRRFDINDRSLGFRWFFSFMLFTQFRVARSGPNPRPLLFLFDEPASNLHAAAQQKLIDSFPEIAQGEHVLAYSTHSHYMIEPKWLEQTFIVTNRADAPEMSVLDEISLDDDSLDVQVSSYRAFVNCHPKQISYFQPILDRLEVIPSRFDIKQASIVLEGKSDYYLLRYAQRLLDLRDIPLLPCLGAGTFGALAALHVGWNLNFLFLLDGDRQGKVEHAKYQRNFGVLPHQIATLDELIAGATVIEDLLDQEALDIVQTQLKLGRAPNKGEICRFFQEQLASNNVNSLGSEFASRTKALLEVLETRLNVPK